MKTALTIAGSDCSGGAGIQADLKTFAAHGIYGMSAITSVVAENTCRVLKIEDISPETIGAQITAIFEDIPPDAVKIGMISGIGAMEAVGTALELYAPKSVVLDPVMVSSSGSALMQEEALHTLKKKVLPHATVLTPNLPEAETLIGKKIVTPEEQRECCHILHSMGPKWILLKGGHLYEDTESTDLLFDGTNFFSFSVKRIPTKNTHGTGCTLSAAIASNLALGYSVEDSVAKAKDYITVAIAHGLDLGKGHGPTHHFYNLYQHGL